MTATEMLVYAPGILDVQLDLKSPICIKKIKVKKKILDQFNLKFA